MKNKATMETNSLWPRVIGKIRLMSGKTTIHSSYHSLERFLSSARHEEISRIDVYVTYANGKTNSGSYHSKQHAKKALTAFLDI